MVALADRCVHRRFPLSESRLEGDTIVCGYHGFTYDNGGSCVFVPGQKRIPRTARVPSYPVVEQDSLVWVWIGDADKADVDLIPRATWLADPAYTTVCGMEPLAARYELLVDNLLDLSHETYLHGGYIGTPEVADTPIITEVDEDKRIIYVSRHMDDAACPPFYAKSTGIDGRITRWQDIEYHPPCLYLLHSRIAPAGVLPGPSPRSTSWKRSSKASRRGTRSSRSTSTPVALRRGVSSSRWPNPAKPPDESGCRHEPRLRHVARRHRVPHLLEAGHRCPDRRVPLLGGARVGRPRRVVGLVARPPRGTSVAPRRRGGAVADQQTTGRFKQLLRERKR